MAQPLTERVARTADATLAEHEVVSAIDVLVGMRWLTPSAVDRWRQGRVEDLESVAQVDVDKLTAAMGSFRRWASDRGLHPSETEYVARTRDRQPLRFSRSGDEALERASRRAKRASGLSAVVVRFSRSRRRYEFQGVLVEE